MCGCERSEKDSAFVDRLEVSTDSTLTANTAGTVTVTVSLPVHYPCDADSSFPVKSVQASAPSGSEGRKKEPGVKNE